MQHILTFLISFINEIAPSKEVRTKNNNQDWFDREVADLIDVLEKLFLKFKKPNFISMRKFTKTLGTKFKT